MMILLIYTYNMSVVTICRAFDIGYPWPVFTPPQG